MSRPLIVWAVITTNLSDKKMFRLNRNFLNKTVITRLFSGMILAGLLLFKLPPVISAQTPVFDVVFLVKDATAGLPFIDTLSFPAGNKLIFKILVRNSQPSTVAKDTVIKVSLPTESFVNAPVNLIVFSSNGAVSTAKVALHATTPGGAVLNYVPGSTRVTWDADNNGWLDFSNAVWSDGITSSNGVVLGDLVTCNVNFCVANITFTVESLAGSAQAPVVPVVGESLAQAGPVSPQAQTAAGGQAQASASAGTLPKTGAYELILASFGLAIAVVVGWKLRGFNRLSLKYFVSPFAAKLSQGRQLSFYDLSLNRMLVKKAKTQR